MRFTILFLSFLYLSFPVYADDFGARFADVPHNGLYDQTDHPWGPDEIAPYDIEPAAGEDRKTIIRVDSTALEDSYTGAKEKRENIRRIYSE